MGSLGVRQVRARAFSGFSLRGEEPSELKKVSVYTFLRAGPEKSESVRDSRIGRIMIQHVGWKGGRHGWQNPIHRIYVSAWCWRFWEVNPGARRRAALTSVRAA